MVFDGHYVYIGDRFRYDPSVGAFNDGAAWTSVDPSKFVAQYSGALGAAFDGRYVYFAPSGVGAVRYDTHGPYTAASSWTSFNLAAPNPSTSGYCGAVFDGRYVYYVPFWDSNNVEAGSSIVRYDTHAQFDAVTSWSNFDTTTLDPKARSFAGGAFDGRYVYFVPYAAGDSLYTLEVGRLVRYDTTASFGSASAWQVFNLGVLDPNAYQLGFFGAAYDGRYLYLVPWTRNGGLSGSEIMRFDTKTPGWVPSTIHGGSFF